MLDPAFPHHLQGQGASHPPFSHPFLHSARIPLHCKPAPSWVWDTRPVPGVLVTVTLRQKQNPLKPAQVKGSLCKILKDTKCKNYTGPQNWGWCLGQPAPNSKSNTLSWLCPCLSEAPVLSISQLCQPRGLGFDLRPSSWWSEDGHRMPVSRQPHLEEGGRLLPCISFQEPMMLSWEPHSSLAEMHDTWPP